MNKLRQSLRRRKPAYVPEASRPHQWQADEESVRKSKCSFPVRYLGHVEVEESRGMHVCEEAVKKLKMAGSKSVKAVLWVSADGLRVVDDKTKDLIVDQTIEKVSFCAPDRNYDRAFSYICRDGTTRRWICHCFLTLKDSGERLSHAVGCAFAACLERKQRREKECGVTACFDASRTCFVREGSFRVTPPAGRQDSATLPQEERKAEAIPAPPAAPPSTASPPEGAASPVDRVEPGGRAIPRRHAPIEQLARQGSFRGFPALSQKNSPFKRQLSLRLGDLPSSGRETDSALNPEMDFTLSAEADGINALCTQINTSFSRPSGDPFSNTSTNGIPACTVPPAIPPPPAPLQSAGVWMQETVSQVAPPHRHKRTPSEAERWLEEVAQAVRTQQQQPLPPHTIPSHTQPPHALPTLPGSPGSLSTLAGPQGPLSTLPGPPGPLSTLPGPQGSLSTLPGPPHPLSTLPGPQGSLSTLPGQQGTLSIPSGPQGSLSTLPGPQGSLSTLPGPQGTLSIPSGPQGPLSTLPGPQGSLSTLPGPQGPLSTLPGPQGSLSTIPGSLPTSMHPFPTAFDSTPTPVGMFGPSPLQPAFVPLQAYPPAPGSSMAYSSASVPVVGITPSQMVANAFCSAAGSGLPSVGNVGFTGARTRAPTGGAQVFHSGLTGPPLCKPTAMNGLPLNPAVTAPAFHDGSSAGWPPDNLALASAPPTGSQDAEQFEAQWAALESRAPQKTANPFSNDLYKTFQIEL